MRKKLPSGKSALHHPDETGPAERLVGLLSELGLTVATAESCTGGGVAFLITSVPGSSRVFQEGYITYSNRAKQELLGVPSVTLAQHGAVSRQTVSAMARGCLKVAMADVAVAVSGIAGPDGGTAQKPVGTVFIAVAGKSFLVAKKVPMAKLDVNLKALNNNDIRRFVREKSSLFAIRLLESEIKKHKKALAHLSSVI